MGARGGRKESMLPRTEDVIIGNLNQRGQEAQEELTAGLLLLNLMVK